MLKQEDVLKFSKLSDDAMIKAFFDNTAKDASDEQLQKWINALSVQRNRTVEKSLAINHFQMHRLIKSLNSSNEKTQQKISFLTLMAILLAVIQSTPFMEKGLLKIFQLLG